MKHTPTICVVDDDADVRASLRSFLRSAGVKVRLFASAGEFLASADQGDVDCVVTDLHMEGMDGIALQKELRRQHRRYPVIVMTAFPSDDTQGQSMSLGAAAYLVKPVDPEVLLHKVETAIA